MPTYRTDVAQYRYLYERPAPEVFGVGQCQVAGVEYISNGTSWALAGTGGGGDGVISVLTYGAVGDGTTNDTAAIQACINSEDLVYIPAGTYLVDRLTLRTGLTIYGDGAKSVLLQNSLTNPVLWCSSAGPSVFITDIKVRDIKLLGKVATLGFLEHTHLMTTVGVQRVTVENVIFEGFRGDGYYIGANDVGGTEHHNSVIKVRNCVFDGLINDNRNGISVIDCTDLLIEGCSFYRVARNNQPGCIDIEPNFAWDVVKNIRVIGNHFEDCNGNVGLVSVAIGAHTFTSQPRTFVVANNTCYSPTMCFFFFQNVSNYNQNSPFDICVTGNSGHAARLFTLMSKVHGATITNNTFRTSTACLLGFAAGDTANQCYITGNVLTSDNSDHGGMLVASGSNIYISNNIFNNYAIYAIQCGAASGASLSNLAIVNNVFCNTRGVTISTIEALGGIDGSTCRLQGNSGVDTNKHNFPAWITDNCGIVVNGTTAVSFNSATLPDSFPVGESTAVIDGDTGVPSTTGAYQGVLKTFRFSSKSGYEDFIYQTYFHANNALKLGSFFIRRRDSASNTWTAWTEQAS